MNKRSGISMFILLITVIVIIILASTITLSISSLSNKHKINIFVNNLSTIEEYISSLNILKEEMPFDEDLTIDEVRAKLETENLEAFNNEILSNGDNTTTYFKKVNLSKLEINEKNTGYEKKGQNDIYIYSENTGIVYYLKGIKLDENIYFSINDKLTNIVK